MQLSRIVLYNHGVGFFEWRGTVEGEERIDLSFRAEEMNDVLKSLTTLDTGGGTVSTIAYDSQKPIDRKLAEIAIHLPDRDTLSTLLTQLKGARLAVDIGKDTIEGLVTGLEVVPRRQGDEVVETRRIALLLDGGAVRHFDLLEVKQMRFLDEHVRNDLQTLLDLRLSATRRDRKRLSILTRGEGERDVVVTYVVEAPVWKTSYRLLLDSADENSEPTLQGWAIVDNTQDEDWEDVDLTLVSGMPISFHYDLYRPRHRERPTVEVEEEAAIGPPVLETGGAFDLAAGAADMEREEAPRAEKVKKKSRRRSRADVAPAPKAQAMSGGGGVSHLLSESSADVQAETEELGDLFVYDIEEPVTIRRNNSALVPIVQTTIEGERVAIYSPEVHAENPLSAFRITNTTGLTLEGGPITVVDGDTYVGEAMLDTLKPNEERITPYSVELGCRIKKHHSSKDEEVHRCTLSFGYLYLHRRRIKKTVYRIDNRTDRPLTLYFDHPIERDTKLESDRKPVEETDNYYRFRIEVPPDKEFEEVVLQGGTVSESRHFTGLTSKDVTFYSEQGFLDDEKAQTIKGLVDDQQELNRLRERLGNLETEIESIVADHDRLRKNLDSLGTSEQERNLRERLVEKLGQGEDRIEELRAEVKSLRVTIEEKEDALETRVSELEF